MLYDEIKTIIKKAPVLAELQAHFPAEAKDQGSEWVQRVYTTGSATRPVVSICTFQALYVGCALVARLRVAQMQGATRSPSTRPSCRAACSTQSAVSASRCCARSVRISDAVLSANVSLE